VVEATQGNNEAAVKNLRRAEELYGDNITQVFRYAHLAMGYGLAGEREDAVRSVAALEERAQESPVGEAVWALAYIALGDYDQALDRLKLAMAAPSSASYVTLLEIKANPWADPILDEPRFREVVDSLWSE
jgi:tetratricopeptide (TPR) repeat protein